MSRIQLEPLRGFRDILPPESEELETLANIFRRVARLYGYREVIPPTLERFELFALKSGEEIRRSMYVFKDKAGREVALRPEVTASIARIYLKHLRGLPKPIRLYYIVPCFRYEEPQFARYREFFQAGVELIGERAPFGDVEVATVLVEFYSRLGMVKHIELVVGHTGLYRSIFKRFGVPEEVQDKILHLMDKKEFDKALDIASAYSGELTSILSSLWDLGDIDSDDKFEEAKRLVSKVSDEAAQRLSELKIFAKIISNLGVSVKTSLSFARGLAYYTGIIFEVKVPEFPVSIAGGGRYDTLIEVYGGESMPSTGFAVGLDRTLLAMKQVGVEVPLETPKYRVAVIVLEDNPELVSYALRVAKVLVDAGVESQFFTGKKLGKLLPRLAEQGLTHAVIIGVREYSEGKVAIKDLRSKEQKTIEISMLTEVFR